MDCIGRYTTPVCYFELDIDPELLKDCRISFAQFGQILFHKMLSDCEIEGNILKCRLSEEETGMLSRFLVLKVQIRALFIDGTLDNSNVIKLKVEDVLDNTPFGQSGDELDNMIANNLLEAVSDFDDSIFTDEEDNVLEW